MTELEKCMAGELYNCHDEIFHNIRMLVSGDFCLTFITD